MPYGIWIGIWTTWFPTAQCLGETSAEVDLGVVGLEQVAEMLEVALRAFLHTDFVPEPAVADGREHTGLQVAVRTGTEKLAAVEE